jgi:transcriptional regulator with XRE-family HTH domain
MATREPAVPIDADTVGGRLRKLRKLKGYTQLDVAALTGLTNTAIANYEKNYREPKYKVLQIFAGLYSTSIQYLITGEKNNQEITPAIRSLIDKIQNLSDKDRRVLFQLLNTLTE